MAEMDASDFSDITPHSGHTMGELLGVEELAMLNADNDDPAEAEEGRAIFPAEVCVGLPRPPPPILIQILGWRGASLFLRAAKDRFWNEQHCEQRPDLMACDAC